MDRTARRLRIALLVSLGINLLVAGAAAGVLIVGRGAPPPRVELSLGPFARALPEADRRAIRSALLRSPDLRPPGPAARAAEMEALLAALRAEPFDPARLESLLETRAARAAAAIDAGQAALVARIAGMDPGRRAAFADRLAEVADGRR